MAIDFTKPSPAPEAPPERPGPKVVLTKEKPKVSLEKGGTAAGTIRVNLNWNPRPPRSLGGFFRRKDASDEAIDLDLGCLYRFTDGCIGVVQSLGRAFVSKPEYGPAPIIRLDGDDRSGRQSDGENLYIDLGQMQHIRRILVFASIYSGATNWASAAGIVTMYPQNAQQVEISLNEHDPKARHCAIAMLENINGQLGITREVRYVQGTHQQLDEAYDWGLRWTIGHK